MNVYRVAFAKRRKSPANDGIFDQSVAHVAADTEASATRAVIAHSGPQYDVQITTVQVEHRNVLIGLPEES